MNEYEKGYQQALKDINTPMQVIIEKWEPSRCPRCHSRFDEECDDGYYARDTSMYRCPYCGQSLKWYS
jgi:DNA-directed RNA polymerase subunit RPC12/RpoP